MGRMTSGILDLVLWRSVVEAWMREKFLVIAIANLLSSRRY
jgi:hypothetical protein